MSEMMLESTKNLFRKGLDDSNLDESKSKRGPEQEECGSPLAVDPSFSLNKAAQFSFPLPNTMMVPAVVEVFKAYATKNGFGVIDDDSNQVIAVKDQSFLKTLVLRCLPCIVKGASTTVMAVKLIFVTNATKTTTSAVIRGLTGEQAKLRTFFSEFTDALDKYESQAGSPRSSKMTQSSFFSDRPLHEGMTSSTLFPQYHKVSTKNVPVSIKEEEEEGSQTKSNLESHSIYHFNKILSSDAYTLGKKVSDFIKDFLLNYRNIEESSQLLPQPIESIMLMTNEAVETLFMEFNYGKNETRRMMPFCRFSVEKYIFEKLYSTLNALYLHKNIESIDKFHAKKTKISENSLETVLKSLDIKKRLWLINEKNGKGSHHKSKESNGASELERRLYQLADNEIPYSSATNELDKLEKLWNPREKLNCLLMMQSLMRSCVVDFYKGKEELQSMDDELPITIFIVLNTKNTNLAADLNFIEDYISRAAEFDYEQKLITNLKCAIQYISNEWTIDTPA
jgi:hypothetical protein